MKTGKCSLSVKTFSKHSVCIISLIITTTPKSYYDSHAHLIDENTEQEGD